MAAYIKLNGIANSNPQNLKAAANADMNARAAEAEASVRQRGVDRVDLSNGLDKASPKIYDSSGNSLIDKSTPGFYDSAGDDH